MPNTDPDFVSKLIKGRIVETIFHQMFQELTTFTIIPLGYENLLPILAQYQHVVKTRTVLSNIRDIPDFILISENKKFVHLVETKYRHNYNPKDILNIAEDIERRWQPTFLFIASNDQFYFDKCSDIIKNKGVARNLDTAIIESKDQKKYLSILKEFLH